MKISRANYETFFMDFLDGKLTEEEVARLHIFLEFNPDLAAELEGIETLKLEPAGIEYNEKDSLRKRDLKPLILQAFDHYCIASMECDLDDAEEKALQQLVDQDVLLERNYHRIRQLRLEPDPGLHFPNPGRLKHRMIERPWVRNFALPAAAIIAILLALPFLLPPAGQGPMTERINHSAPAPAMNPDVIPFPGGRHAEDLIDDPVSGGTAAGRIDAPPAAARNVAVPAASRTDAAPAASRTTAPREADAIAEHPSGSAVGLTADSVLERIPSLQAKSVEQGSPAHKPEHLFTWPAAVYACHESTGPEGTALKRSLWKLADAGIQLLDQGSPEDYSFEVRTDEKGRTRNLTFETPFFGISAPLRPFDRP